MFLAKSKKPLESWLTKYSGTPVSGVWKSKHTQNPDIQNPDFKFPDIEACPVIEACPDIEVCPDIEAVQILSVLISNHYY